MTAVRMADGTVRDMASFADGEFGVACTKRQVLAVIEPQRIRAQPTSFQARPAKPLTESQQRCVEGL